MKNSNKKSLIINCLVIALAYYLIPAILGPNILSLFIINPFTALICTYTYSKDNNFSFILLILSVLLFIPSIYIFYNDSALIYAVFILISSIIGNIIGSIKYKKKG